MINYHRSVSIKKNVSHILCVNVRPSTSWEGYMFWAQMPFIYYAWLGNSGVWSPHILKVAKVSDLSQTRHLIDCKYRSWSCTLWSLEGREWWQKRPWASGALVGTSLKSRRFLRSVHFYCTTSAVKKEMEHKVGLSQTSTLKYKPTQTGSCSITLGQVYLLSLMLKFRAHKITMNSMLEGALLWPRQALLTL